MKKSLFVFAMLLICMAFGAAGASPSITDGGTTGWIAENNYLFLQNQNGQVSQLPLAIDDLVRMKDDEIICRTSDGRTIAVKKDGSGSRIVDEAEADSQTDPQPDPENGILLLKDRQVSDSACAAATDGIYLYYAEKSGLSCILRVIDTEDVPKTVPEGSRGARALALSGRNITEPLSMTVTREALTLTGKDHQITVISLLTGEAARYPAVSEETEAACVTGGKLYRYRLAEERKWIYESGSALSTPSPAPTAKPTQTPKPTPQQYTDEDGTIYYGAYGKKVRKIQERLYELGYPILKIDGKYGQETQLAIDLFCDAIHVREHRYITRKVQNRLFAKDAPVYDPYLPLKLGDQGVSVLYMQMRLKELGYDPGKTDGIYGKNTMAAVALFQQDFGIQIGDKEKFGEAASHEMLELLYSPEPWPTAEPTATPSPTPVPTFTPAPTQEPTATPVPATQTDL